MRKRTKILAWFLCLILLIGFVPVNIVWAEGTGFPGVETLPSDFPQQNLNVTKLGMWNSNWPFLTGSEGDMTDPTYLANYIYTRLHPGTSTVLLEGCDLYQNGQYQEALKKYRDYFIEKVRKSALEIYPMNYEWEQLSDLDDMVVGKITTDRYLELWSHKTAGNANNYLNAYGSPYDEEGDLNYVGKDGYESQMDWLGGLFAPAATGQYQGQGRECILSWIAHLPYSYWSHRNEEGNDIYKDKFFQVLSDFSVNQKRVVDAYALNHNLTAGKQSGDNRFYSWQCFHSKNERFAYVFGSLVSLCKLLPAEGTDCMPEITSFKEDISEPCGKANPAYYDEIPVIPFCQWIVHMLNNEVVNFATTQLIQFTPNQKSAALYVLAKLCAIFSEFDIFEGAEEIAGEKLNAVWDTIYKDGAYLEASFNYNDDIDRISQGLINFMDSMNYDADWAVQYKKASIYYQRLKEGFQSSALLLPKMGNGGSELQMPAIWKDTDALGRYKTEHNYTADIDSPMYSSVYFPYGGYATLRSGWKIEEDISLSTWNSEYFGEGHKSPYINAVWLTAYGRPLIMSGEGHIYNQSYLPEEEQANYDAWLGYFSATSTKKGSTVMVNGQDQLLGSEEYLVRTSTAGASIIGARYGTSAYFDYIEGNFRMGYANTEYHNGTTSYHNADTDTSHMRQNIMVREADLWIITDTMTNTGEEVNEYSQIWRFPAASDAYENYNGFTKDQVVIEESANTIRTQDPGTVNLFMTQISNEALSYQKYYGSRGEEEGGDGKYRGWTAKGISGVRMPSVDVYVEWTDSEANKNTQVITVATPSQTEGQPYESLIPRNDAAKGLTGFELVAKNGVVVTNYTAPAAMQMEAAGVKATATNLTVTQNNGVVRGVVLDCESISCNNDTFTPPAASFEFEVRDGNLVVTSLIAVPNSFEWIDAQGGKYYPEYFKEAEEILANAVTKTESAFANASVECADAATVEAAKAYVESLLAALDLNGASFYVTTVGFTAATEGTVEVPNGIDGTYTFTVTLSKEGGETVTTKELKLSILASKYVPELPEVIIPDNVDKISVKKLVVNAADWQYMSTVPTFDGGMVSLDNLDGAANSSVGYAGKKFRNTVFEFAYKHELDVADGWTGIYLSLERPGTTICWADKGVLVCLYPDRIQLQVRDNSGQSVDLEKKGIGLESGKTYDVQLGMYNVSETEVRILLTVDGKTVWDEVIENELLASSDYYFCCSSIQNTKISIGEKVVEPDKVSVGTLIADTDNWKSFNAEPVFDEGFMSLDTLTVDKTASAGYAGQKFKNSIFEFTYKAQTSAAQGQGWTGLYLDMNNPGTTYAWSIKGVLVTLYDNRSELQIYDNKGQTIVGDKTVPFEIGRTYQMQFGMYDVSDTEVRIIVTADGNTIWNEVIESELLVSAEKYFCITAALHNKAIVSASEEPEEDPAIPVIIPEESDKYVIYGNTATISSDADYRRLLNVMVDDEVADPSDYTVGARATATPRVGGNTGDSGTAVTFHRNYLENLSVGDHVVQLNYEEGKRASTILTVLPAADSDNYNIAVIGSQSKVVDEQAIISIMPYHADKETWNAVDLTLTYDTEKLTFATTTLEGYSIKHDRENGAIQIIGYGDDKACELDTIDLAFIADRVGDAAVTLISAKVDESGNAIAKDAPEASVAVAAATIRITGYPVTLPDGFVGEATVTPGEDYTFIAGNTNYDYVLAAEVNGEEVTITGSGTEQDPYTVKAGDLTGNLVIILKNRTPKTFAVIITEGADVTGDDQATYGEDYTFIIAKQDGYGYSMPAVTIGGQTYKAFSVSGNSYTIPGADIVGEIRIAVVKTALSADQVTVTVQGTGAGDVEAAAQAEKNTRFTFIVNKVSGYKYAVRATVDGRTVELTGAGTTENPYAIAAEDVTDNILITVDKELTAYTMRISVSEYLKLQERKSVFLVKAAVEGELPEGKIPAYDGNGMYWSEKYNAYCWLVISGNTSDAVEAEAKEKIVTAHANKVAIAYTGDVNLTGTVDVNDAQLAYDMYNAKYSDFVKTSAQKFLSADVNADGVVNVSDATAIVNIILSGK